MELHNCKQFIIDTYKNQVACNATDFLQLCRSLPNCPKKLKTVAENEFFEFVRNLNLDIKLMENDTYPAKRRAQITFGDSIAVKYFVKILTKKGQLSVIVLSGHWNQAPSEVKEIIKSTNENLFKEFLSRNSFFFELNDNNVSVRCSPVTDLCFDVDSEDYIKAIQYFIQKIKAKGKQTFQQLVSCLSHDGTAEIIGTVGSRKLADVERFLGLFPSLFLVSDNLVTVFNDKVLHESFSVSVSSKQQNSVNAGIEVINRSENKNENIEFNGTNRNLKVGDSDESEVFDDQSKTVLNNLFGKKFMESLNQLLFSINLKNLNKVEMLWFDINRKPSVKIKSNYLLKERCCETSIVYKATHRSVCSAKRCGCWKTKKVCFSISKEPEPTQALNEGLQQKLLVLIDTPELKYAIHELSDQPYVRSDFFKSLFDKLLCISPTVYRLEGYLHTFRVNRCGDIPIGVTMFHQVHYPQVEAFDELEKLNLRVILYDRFKTTSNHLYSYLRKICANLSIHHHVFAVDLNGKITGYNSVPFLGKSRYITCSSLDSCKNSLFEAFSHNPDYIVTNSLDVVDEDILKLLQSFSKQGVKIVFPLNNEYKDLINF